MKFKKTEGGQGGKRGHSNMTHWEGTEIVKEKSKRARRQVDRAIKNLSGFKPSEMSLEEHSSFA